MACTRASCSSSDSTQRFPVERVDRGAWMRWVDSRSSRSWRTGLCAQFQMAAWNSRLVVILVWSSGSWSCLVSLQQRVEPHQIGELPGAGRLARGLLLEENPHVIDLDDLLGVHLGNLQAPGHTLEKPFLLQTRERLPDRSPGDAEAGGKRSFSNRRRQADALRTGSRCAGSGRCSLHQYVELLGPSRGRSLRRWSDCCSLVRKELYARTPARRPKTQPAASPVPPG